MKKWGTKMFEEKDYLMKMVKEFSTAIGKIMGLKAEKKITESQKVLDDTLKYFTNLNKEVIEALPYEILIHKVSGGRQLSPEKCLMLSELLTQQADIYEIEGDKTRAKSLYTKSLNILISALLNAEPLVLEQNQAKADDLIARISWFDAPNESKLLIFQYYELGQNYAKAEDVLFNLIETNNGDKEIFSQGIAFYERLLVKDDAELEKGNLPMDEVLEGLANLKEYRE